MTTQKKRWLTWAALLAMALAAAPEAAAFFPIGDFVGNEFVKIRWPKSLMDTNGDGDVSGVDEGVPITLEAGVNGFSAEERRLIEAAFETWEAIPSSYVAFTFTQPVRSGDDIIDPDEPLTFNDSDIGNIDGWNYVGSVTEDSGDNVIPGEYAAWAMYVYIAEDAFLEVNGETIEFDGPAFIDYDCAFRKGSYQVNEDFDTSATGFPLQALMTHMAGFAVGLDESPLYNFNDAIPLVDDNNEIVGYWDLEPKSIALRDAQGVLQEAGTTPTMFPEPFFVMQTASILRSGYTTLAPDDIAGATWIYPREDRRNFFDLSQEAWFTARQGVPTAPIPGAHIRAWCDTDNNPATARVPMYDTYTGLYETAENTMVFGRFHLYEMFKELETSGGQRFDATYTITMHQDLIFPAHILEESDYTNASFDSTHRGDGVSPLPFTPFRFLSQTFVEGGENIFSYERADDGTPLKFEEGRGIVSDDSGQTLAQILPGREPMFGDTGTVCPLNMVVSGLTTSKGPDALRRLRDSLLLQTPLGAMVSDAYYRAAPGMSRFLMAHPAVFAVAQGAAWTVEVLMAHWRTGVGFAGLLGAAVFMGLRRRRWAAAAVLLLPALLWTPAADAQLAKRLTLPEMVAKSDYVCVCTVVGMESRFTEEGKIVTDVTIEVSDAPKGRLNKGAQVYFTQYGGQVGPVVARSPQLPRWRKGEEAVVFFRENKKLGLEVVAGRYGKWAVATDPETQEKFLKTRAADKHLLPEKAASVVKGSSAGAEKEGGEVQKDGERRVWVEDFAAWVRHTDAQQTQEKDR